MSPDPVPTWLMEWRCASCGGRWWTETVGELLAQGRAAPSCCPFCGQRQERRVEHGRQRAKR